MLPDPEGAWGEVGVIHAQGHTLPRHRGCMVWGVGSHMHTLRQIKSDLALHAKSKTRVMPSTPLLSVF